MLNRLWVHFEVLLSRISHWRLTRFVRTYLFHVVISFVMVIIVEFLRLLWTPKRTVDDIAPDELILIFLLTGALVELFTKFYEFSHWEAVQLFERVVTSVPRPFQGYVEGRLEEEMKGIRSEIHRLEFDGLSGRTLSEKLSIVTSLLPFAHRSVSNRYWATTLDRPSDLWLNHQTFFYSQRTNLKCADRRRIVIVSDAALHVELSCAETRRALAEFVQWHRQVGFQLRFLVGSQDTFVRHMRGHLDLKARILGGDRPLPGGDRGAEKEEGGDARVGLELADFAIVGDEWVYGELISGEEGGREDGRIVQLHRSNFRRGGKVSAYGALYEEIWDSWSGFRWPILSAEQVASECERLKRQELHAGSLEAEYPDFATLRGQELFEGVCSAIGSSASIEAVDVAPLKSEAGLAAWSEEVAYLGFKEATIAAASRTGGTCKRVYILRQGITTAPAARKEYDDIFRPQIEGNVDVFLTSLDQVMACGLAVHDFIIFDEAAFVLGWQEQFVIEELSPERNLAAKQDVIWYRQVFESISEAKGGVKRINDMSMGRVLDYMQSLCW